MRRRDATHAVARARAAHPPPDVVGVCAVGQEVDLVRHDYEGVGGADDGGEVGGEGAVEVEEVDHRDDQAAAAREALEQLTEVLRLEILVLRRGTNSQGFRRQPVLVTQAVAPGSG